MTSLDGNVQVAATVLSFDTDRPHLAGVEELLCGLADAVGLPPDAVVCTHVALRPARHYAITVAFPTRPPAELVEAVRGRLGGVNCESARAEVRAGHGGRAVIFPGEPVLRGRVPVADALARTAIDRVEVLGGRSVAPDDQLETRDFVRPLYRFGELVLPVLATGPDVVVPFEACPRSPG